MKKLTRIPLLCFLSGLIVAAGVLCAPNASMISAHCGDESHGSASLWCQDAHEHYNVISKALTAASAVLMVLGAALFVSSFASPQIHLLLLHAREARCRLRFNQKIPPPLFSLLFADGILHPKSP